jgi:hypothetical protein
VKPDSTGDVPTISAAVDSAAAQGDTVVLGNGTFTGAGNREVDCLDKAVVISSKRGDPNLCTIDLGTTYPGDINTALHFRASQNGIARLEGITIENGCMAVICHEVSAPVISNCVFRDNRCAGGDCSPGGGAVLCKAGSSPLIIGCEFYHNYGGRGGGIECIECSASIVDCSFSDNSGDGGGAIGIVRGSARIVGCSFLGNFSGNPFCNLGGGAVHCAGSAELIDCDFRGNISYGGGGGFRYWPDSEPDLVTFTRCIFIGNRALRSNAESPGGAIFAGYWLDLYQCDIVITNCTFSGNSTEEPYCGSALATTAAASVLIENTVIAFGGGGGAVCCLGAPAPEIACTNIYGNTGGDWTDCIAGQHGVNGNFSADPKFCDTLSGYFWVEECSPCLPGNHPDEHDCEGIIGAYGAGCVCGAATERTTWGAIKSIYR